MGNLPVAGSLLLIKEPTCTDIWTGLRQLISNAQCLHRCTCVYLCVWVGGLGSGLEILYVSIRDVCHLKMFNTIPEFGINR